MAVADLAVLILILLAVATWVVVVQRVSRRARLDDEDRRRSAVEDYIRRLKDED
jgi:hypothetical protein